jgi:hypothetical protein
MSDLSRIRVSDADRHGVIDRLQEATSEGRLNLDELDVRITDALAARTWSDLDVLVDDLPDPPEYEWAEPADEPLPTPMAGVAASAGVVGLAALSIAVSFWTAWGNVLGLAAVLLGVFVLLAPVHLSPRMRLAILGGVTLGLLPTTFYVALFLIIGL